MKKGLYIIAFAGIILISGYALFKLLISKEDGKITETNPETLGDPIEKTGKEGSEEKGESINPEKN